MIKLLFAAAMNGASDEPNRYRAEDTEYTHDDFMEMSLADLEEITGVIRPLNQTTTTIDEYRQAAWDSYRQDISNRDEWGGNQQDDETAVRDEENDGFDEPDINLDNVIEDQLNDDSD